MFLLPFYWIRFSLQRRTLYEDPKISGLGSEFVSAFDTRKIISQVNQMRRRRGGGGGGGQIIIKRTSIVTTIVLFICAISLFFIFRRSKYPSFFLILNDNRHPSSVRAEIGMDELSTVITPGGWRPSSAPRVDWPPPPYESNGYLCIRSYADLIERRTEICNAVFIARIMNATLVLPDFFYFSWQVKGGFLSSVYDVKHFIKSLRNDIQIVENLPEIYTHGNMEAYKIPGMYAPINWFTTTALEKMKKHGAISINSPSSYNFKEGIFINEYQRLRCRVNYHAFRFKPQLMKLSKMIVSKLRSHGPFLAIRFETDRLVFGMCYEGILTPEDGMLLPHTELMPGERRDPCPLTPEMVGLILRAMGFDNSTRIYLVGDEFFGGERYMKPFLELFPHLENHKTVIPANEELSEYNTLSLAFAVDYMVSLQADIFMPTHTGSSNFATNVLDHRLYYGFRTTIQPDREALLPIFVDREEKKRNETAASASTLASFEEAVRQVMLKTSKFGGAQERGRVRGELSYINPWPDCFCQISSPKNSADNCPPGENLTEVVNSFFGFIA